MGKKYLDRKDNPKFVRPGGQYSWSPDTTILKIKDEDKIIPTVGCTAIAGSNSGPDSWDSVVTYVYNKIFVSGIERHVAYVECGYVE